MAKPRLSEGRIPFQLGIDAGIAPPGVPIVHGCAALTQQPKPLAALLFTAKPIAALTQRPC